MYVRGGVGCLTHLPGDEILKAGEVFFVLRMALYILLCEEGLESENTQP